MALYIKRPRLDEEQIGRGIAKFAATLLNTRSCVYVCRGGGGCAHVWLRACVRACVSVLDVCVCVFCLL